MVTLEQIAVKVGYAKNYYSEKFEEYRLNLIDGCKNCCDEGLGCLSYLITALQFDLDGEINTDVTQSLYNKLSGILGGYNQAFTYDPNVYVPGTTIVVEAPTSPYEIMFGYDDFIDNGLDGRIRYDNPDWAGWLPLIEIGGVALNFGIPGVADDYYPLSSGGFVLLPTGNIPAFYDLQVARTVGYEPYTVVVTPPVITVQPVAQTVVVAGTINLSVTATNAYFYQWYKNGVSISGATGTTLTITNAQVGDAGTYSVVVSNVNASVTSNNVVVTVNVVQVGVALIQNNSIQTITYSDDGSGATSLLSGAGYFKNPIVNGQSMIIFLPVPSGVNITVTYTRYNPNGTVNFTISATRAPSPQLNIGGMDILKRHEFIITST